MMTMTWCRRASLAAILLLVVVGTANSQVLPKWERTWLRVTEEFNGLCDMDGILREDRSNVKGFLYMGDFYDTPPWRWFAATLFTESGGEWEAMDLDIFPTIGSEKDFVAWFQEAWDLLYSGYVRLVMVKPKGGEWTPAAMQTYGGNYAAERAGRSCQGALLIRGKVIPSGKVPPELLGKKP